MYVYNGQEANAGSNCLECPQCAVVRHATDPVWKYFKQLKERPVSMPVEISKHLITDH